MTVKLPVLSEDKKHISYSEVSTWIECAWRHKLKYLDKIDLDHSTVHTEFGRVTHDMLEHYLRSGEMPDLDQARQKLVETFAAGNITVESEKEWHDTLPQFAAEVPVFMQETFKDWQFIGAEDKLYETIEGHTLLFKGFLDGIIRVPKTSRLKSAKPGEYEYWIIDWKTTSWGWGMDKKTDPKKILQLAFYKYFWSKKLGIDPKEIRCGFVLLKRTAKAGKKVELVAASIGEKTIENGLQIIDKMLFSIKKGLTPKNRNSCKWCPYLNTEHCV